MPDSRKIMREIIAEQSWGADYLREMDLVIAANVLASLKSKATLYNRGLHQVVAERCAPLDGGLDVKRLDTIVIPPDAEEYRRVPAALEALKGLPRGHWAVVKKDGVYGAYMSDGHGGTGGSGDYKSMKSSPEAPDFDFTALYGCLIEYMVYLRRSEIEREIMEHSFKVSGIIPGHVLHDTRINGKEFGKVQFVGVKEGYFVGEGDALELKATRRGVKPSLFMVSISSFATMAEVEPVMPTAFEDAGADWRLVSYFAPADGGETAEVAFQR